jgi:hypothetical protein
VYAEPPTIAPAAAVGDWSRFVVELKLTFTYFPPVLGDAVWNVARLAVLVVQTVPCVPVAYEVLVSAPDEACPSNPPSIVGNEPIICCPNAIVAKKQNVVTARYFRKKVFILPPSLWFVSE